MIGKPILKHRAIQYIHQPIPVTRVPAGLRNTIHPQLVQTGFKDVVDNIVNLIDSLPEKPIVIGHSLAGLVVQKLVEMNKAIAGISIDGAPPKNVLAPWATVKAVWPVVNLFKGNSAFMGSKEWYHRHFLIITAKLKVIGYTKPLQFPRAGK
ncbi:alpha/beta fold hydrolase [Niabella hibiscisoli]|uniref:alpha/beta fold hydrolase n=1 Tax=Niabella hibiscisoli TaxID=1825928 RepID=UPI001F0F44FD|nr:alpha/beta fold hydrolase [Niabella hibiscisoli]MCH5718470.1 alpha/beta fold hydrolase [Niabella hibiscisoli]